MDTPIDDIGRTDITSAVSDMLLAASSACEAPSSTLRLPGLLRVRSLIAERPDFRQSIADLEHVANLDRWSLARQFRAAFGTSPTRFRTMRQLDHVRRLVKSGVSLAEAALDAGFADQSHMSRQFKRAYGLTPAHWAAALHRTACLGSASGPVEVARLTRHNVRDHINRRKTIAGPRIDSTEPCSD
jgi:AraC-like DNA-binding protein